MELIKSIKRYFNERVSLKSIFEYYEYKIPGNGFIRCLWHMDTKPSLKINFEKNFSYCFGCRKVYYAYDYVKYFGMKDSEVYKMVKELGYKGKEEKEEEEKEEREREKVKNVKDIIW